MIVKAFFKRRRYPAVEIAAAEVEIPLKRKNDKRSSAEPL